MPKRIYKFVLNALVLAFYLFCTHTLADTRPVDHSRYDWVPTKKLTETPIKYTAPSCCGAYVDPMAGEQKNTDLSKEPIFIEADSSQMSAEEITLGGQVEIKQASRQIKAGFMTYNQKTDRATLSQNVEIRQQDLLLRGDRAHVNMAGREARFDGSEFVIHSSHIRGSANSIEHKADGTIELIKGSITSCEPGRESWVLKGGKLKINPNTNAGSGRNITVELAGIPVLYTPYITFPIGDARKTGLLVPSPSRREGGGLDFSLPWYWNIAPNYDATIVPRYVSGHGAMVESEFRQLNSLSSNTLNLHILPNDKGGNDPDENRLIEQGTDEKLVRPHKGQDRWKLDLHHQGGTNQRWYTNINYSRVSDVDYVRDLSNESFSNTYLRQNATVGYRLPHWHLSAKVQEYQSLLVDLGESYRLRPRLQLDGRYSFSQWTVSLNNEWAMFTHPDPDFITGQRANFDYNIERNQQWLGGFIHPKVGIQTLVYDLNPENLLESKDSTPSLSAPYSSLDAGLFFERNGGRQTFEPRIFYLYRKYVDHNDLLSVSSSELGASRDINFDSTPLTFSYDQLFREKRFAGGDRLGDANQLTLGFTSEWLNQSMSQTMASISLGKVMYFRDRRVSISNTDQAQTIEASDIAAKMTARIHNHVQVRGDFLYNPKTERLMRTTAGVAFQDNRQRRVTFSYHYVREDQIEQSTLPVNQLDTAAILPINSQWQLVGRIFYDLDEHKELDAFVGFEYDDCCYRIRLLARRLLDSKLAALVDDDNLHYDNSISLEIDLKGLASSGRKIQKLLKQTLPNFRD